MQGTVRPRSSVQPPLMAVTQKNVHMTVQASCRVWNRWHSWLNHESTLPCVAVVAANILLEAPVHHLNPCHTPMTWAPGRPRP